MPPPDPQDRDAPAPPLRVVVRHARPGDVPGIVALVAEGAREGAFDPTYAEPLPGLAEAFLGSIVTGLGARPYQDGYVVTPWRVYVAAAASPDGSDDVVAFLVGAVDPEAGVRGDEAAVELTMCVVARAYRGAGVANALVRRALADYDAAGRVRLSFVRCLRVTPPIAALMRAHEFRYLGVLNGSAVYARGDLGAV